MLLKANCSDFTMNHRTGFSLNLNRPKYHKNACARIPIDFNAAWDENFWDCTLSQQASAMLKCTQAPPKKNTQVKKALW